jgi:opacity protein-like surface antigen
MLSPRFVLAALLASSSFAVAQSFEASIGGGDIVIPTKNSVIGTSTTDPASGNFTLKGGFRLNLRMTLNTWRFMGHEFGYAYNRTSIDTPPTTTTGGIILGQPITPVIVPAQSISVPAHQGFYDFLVYAVPEGKIIRPFACGGVQFSAFSQPGGSYNRETKYGINYGGGLKVKVKENWGFRLDARQYNMGKPFSLPNASGRLLMWEFSGSVSFLM